MSTMVDSSSAVDVPQQTPTTHNAAAPSKLLINYIKKIHKHSVNSDSMAGGSILMFASALHLAWGLWQIATINLSWAIGHSAPEHLFVLYSWFLAAIVGSIFGALIENMWRKTIIYYICGGILTISGIIYIAWNEEYSAILVGRMLAGVAHGILYVTMVSHYADNTFAEMRGFSVSLIAVLINLAAAVVAAFNIYNTDTLKIISSFSDGVIGFFTLILAIIGVAINYFLTYDSVPSSMRRGQEQVAVTDLIKLRKEATLTPSIRYELADMLQMLNEARSGNENIFSNGNIRPLLLVTMLKLQAFLTSNPMLNMLLISFAQVLIGTSGTFVGSVFLTCFRLLASVVAMLAGDLISRKWFLTPAGGISGIVLALFGILLMSVNLNVGFCVLLVLFQALVGFGIDPMNHVITSEAFAINKRAWSIAFTTNVEYTVQLVAMVIMYYFIESDTDTYVIVLVSAILIVIIAGVLHFLLPETCNLSIKQCQDIHRSPKHRSTESSHEINHFQGITHS